MKRTLLASSLALALGASAAARAELPFDQMIVFGASYDDVGQFPDPSFGFSRGLRFTNIDPATGERGRSFPEWLALNLGLGPMAPSSPIVLLPRTDAVETDNINFAVGGYRSEEVLQSITGAQQVQVGPFSSSAPGFLQRLAAGTLQVGPNTLFYALPAGNDIRDLDDPAQTAATSVQIARELVGAGARYIVLPMLPKLGSFAEASNYDADGRTALGEQRTAASLAFNQAYLAGLRATPGNFITVDVTTLFDEVLADPAGFGLSAAIDQTRACFDAAAAGGPGCDEPAGLGASSGGNPDDFVFNDGLHPTQVAARTAADLIESVLRAPGMAAMLPEAVLGDARAYRETVDQHLAQNRWNRPVQGTQLFASVQGTEVDTDSANATPGASSDAVDLTIGASLALGDEWFAGVSVGSQSGDHEIDDRGSEFQTSGLMGSLFAGWRRDIWFADVVLSAGSSDVEDIDRVFALGPALVRRERGETEADVLGFGADVGVDMMPQGSAWRFGPYLGIDYLDIELDGYAEDGASASAMAFDDIARESLVGRAGVFASYPWQMGGARMELRGDVAYFEEFEDDAEDVTAVSKNLSAGPWFRMPGYAIDDNGVRASVGLDAAWNGGLTLGVSYRYDDNAAEAQYLGFSLSYAL